MKPKFTARTFRSRAVLEFGDHVMGLKNYPKQYQKTISDQGNLDIDFSFKSLLELGRKSVTTMRPLNKIEILGNEGAFGTNTTSYLVNGHILIDCSPSTFELLKARKLLDKINIIIFTHKHNDHVGGLSQLVEYKRHIQKTSDYTIYAGAWFKYFYNALACSITSVGYVQDFEYVLATPNKIIKLNNELSVEFLEVTHFKGTIPTLGLKLINNDTESNVIISSDVDDDEVLSVLCEINDETIVAFIDMGWTNLEDNGYMVHPREITVYKHAKILGVASTIDGIHTSAELEFFKKAQMGSRYLF